MKRTGMWIQFFTSILHENIMITIPSFHYRCKCYFKLMDNELGDLMAVSGMLGDLLVFFCCDKILVFVLRQRGHTRNDHTHIKIFS